MLGGGWGLAKQGAIPPPFCELTFGGWCGCPDGGPFATKVELRAMVVVWRFIDVE